MKLTFEENKIENTVRIFQTSGITKIHLASSALLTAVLNYLIEKEK